LETPKQPLSIKELKVPRVTNPHKIQVCDELERWRERENRDEINSKLDRLHLTPRVLQTIEGDAISDVRGELNALVLELVSQEFVERAEVNEEREYEGYIKDPKSWWPLGKLDSKPVETVLKPVEPVSTRGFSVHWKTQPETGPAPNPVEPGQNWVEPVFQKSAHDFFW
jgi:hypothetical protein